MRERAVTLPAKSGETMQLPNLLSSADRGTPPNIEPKAKGFNSSRFRMSSFSLLKIIY